MGKSQWDEPSDVLALRTEIESWRENRKQREPVPASIWSSAVELAERYSVYRISQALRLNYGSLKRRLLELSPRSARTSSNKSEENPACHFVELTGLGVRTAASSPSSMSRAARGPVAEVAMEIEVRDGTGSQLTVRVSNGSTIDVLGLVRSFGSGGQCSS